MKTKRRWVVPAEGRKDERGYRDDGSVGLGLDAMLLEPFALLVPVLD